MIGAHFAFDCIGVRQTMEQILASSRDHRAILRRVARLAVPMLGEWCAVHALEDGRIRLVASAWAGGAHEEEARELLREYMRDGQGPPHAVAQVLRTVTSLRLPPLGPHSCMVVPLRRRRA